MKHLGLALLAVLTVVGSLALVILGVVLKLAVVAGVTCLILLAGKFLFGLFGVVIIPAGKLGLYTAIGTVIIYVANLMRRRG